MIEHTSVYTPTLVQAPTLDVGVQARIDRMAQTAYRVRIGLPDDEQLYKGEWVWQSDKPICAVSSLINAVHTLNKEVTSELQDELYEEAIQPNLKGGYGIQLGVLSDIVSEYPESGIRTHILPEKFALKKIPVVATSQEGEQIMTANATNLKAIIDSNYRMIINHSYPDGSDHAIAVVGYKITDGYVYAQCIDSNLGIVELPLEYVLWYLDPVHSHEHPAMLLVSVTTEQR